MAERRMFARAIVGSARFLRMPASSRLLYYDLGVAADDDGVVEAFTVMRSTGASEDDLRVLASKNFVQVLNDDLVVVILDWRVNNQIRKDRYRPSIYHDSLVSLGLLEQKAGAGLPCGNQNSDFGNRPVNQRLTQYSTGEKSTISSPTAQSAGKGNDASFSAFWNAYPRKAGKGAAQKAFAKVRVSLDILLSALEAQKRSDQWNRDGGQYIPYPATWLNQRRWEDEPPAQPEKDAGPAEDWSVLHPDWADQSTWVPGPDGIYRPVGVKP